ncbi:hypothetical protein LINGRAPRIM_LOCUS678 [Linum grandiflorum]
MGPFPSWVIVATGDDRFSTRAGYQFWYSEVKKQLGPNYVGSPDLWKYLWSLQISPKVKQFCCRFLQDALPTGDHMSKRSSRHEDLCLLWPLGVAKSYLWGVPMAPPDMDRCGDVLMSAYQRVVCNGLTLYERSLQKKSWSDGVSSYGVCGRSVMPTY